MEQATVAPLLNVEEAARMLRTSDTTIRRMVEEGRLRGFRLSEHGPYRIVAEDVERLARGET